MSHPPAFNSFPAFAEPKPSSSSSTVLGRQTPPTSEARGAASKSKHLEDDQARHRKQREHERERSGRPRKTRRADGSRYTNDDERRHEDSKDGRRARERQSALMLAEGQGPLRDIPRAPDDSLAWYESSRSQQGEETSGKVYFEDNVGDASVLRYGIVASAVTPRYRRDVNDMLGLAASLCIAQSRDRTDRGVEIAIRGKPYIRRSLVNMDSKQHIRIAARPVIALEDSYVAFDDTALARNDDVDFRQISAKHFNPEDILHSLGPLSTAEDLLRSKISLADRHLQQHPDDSQAWIAFAELQATTHADLEVGSTRAAAEIRMSVITKALAADRANVLSVELHLAHLRAAEAIWSPSRVTDRWRNVIRDLSERGLDCDDMLRLWISFLDWRQTGGLTNVEDVLKDFYSALQFPAAIDNIQTREENQIYLFLRLCLFLKQAGYTERATAAFQALIEILRRPAEYPGQDFRQLLDAFQHFWESEAPRVGEPGAQGWHRTSAASAAQQAHATVSRSVSRTSDPFLDWSRSEEEAERDKARPARPSDLDDLDDDPFRIVLYGDIVQYLFPVHTPAARLQLWYAFTHFLGLPFTPTGAPSGSIGSTDPHLWWALAANGSTRAAFWPQRVQHAPWQTVGGIPMMPESGRYPSQPYSTPIKSWQQSLQTWYADPGLWFRDLASAALNHIDVLFTRDALSLLRPVIADPAISHASVAFEAASSVKAAVQCAKHILSQNRDDLQLWDGYARLERQRGRIDAARQVYSTTLQATSVRPLPSRSADPRTDAEELWASWVEMEMNVDEERCLDILIAAARDASTRLSQSARSASPPRPSADDSPNVRPAGPSAEPTLPSAIALLKAKHYYRAPFNDMSPSRRSMAFVFSTLHSGIDETRHLVQQYIAALPANSAGIEATWQMLVWLMIVHGSRHPLPKWMLRDTLHKAIDACPDNSMFMSAYLWNESGSRVYGRVRHLVDKLLAPEPSVVSSLWALWAESCMAASTFYQGDNERVRRVLDKAISSRQWVSERSTEADGISGKSCAALWKLYIEFETILGHGTAAKSLAYRAMSALGACKDLYMLPFSAALRPLFTPRELADIAETMVSRGLRVRIAIEEYWTDQDLAVEDGADEEGDVDIEYEALRHIEQAKPY